MTPDDDNPIDLLPLESRRRLDRFASAFQQLGTDVYPAFAAASQDVDERRDALDRVQELIGHGARREGVLAALKEFREYAVYAATNALSGYQAALLTRPNASSAEDRVRFLASLELAVVAVILWDEIEPDERESLLGPWIQMATRAAGA